MIMYHDASMIMYHDNSKTADAKDIEPQGPCPPPPPPREVLPPAAQSTVAPNRPTMAKARVAKDRRMMVVARLGWKACLRDYERRYPTSCFVRKAMVETWRKFGGRSL